jgi:phosphoribosylformimino-5-aminoimidazole carboxamide ribotide isomerase
MQPIPAIDILDGRVVRLLHGDFDDVTVYSEDPVGLAASYVAAGASRIHVVDLSGARGGTISLDLVRSVARTIPDLQIGGGIRTVSTALAVLAAGAARVVVGSLAVRDADALGRLIAAAGASRVVVAVDVREGRARGEGWSDEGVPTRVVVERALTTGAQSLLVTGIDRDGTLEGPDLELLSEVRALAPGVEIIASGGVASLDDLEAVAGAGVDAAVIGRALLAGRFSIEQLLQRFE